MPDDPPRCAVPQVRGARLFALPRVDSPHGSLVWGELGAHLPFTPRRFFCIQGVPPGAVRGEHAHRALEEVVVCLRGSCTFTLDDGRVRDEIVLADPRHALYIPPLTWSTQRAFSNDAVLAVLASEVYRPDDYVRDYASFLALVRGA
jgi:UDP-2-acetamido-3-amino-2,3-dideoxy-glucuronate N-acetyltransferase